MAEQAIDFTIKNWRMIVWTISTLATVVGLIIYNAKVVLPGFVKRMDDMAKDIDELKDSSKTFLTVEECAVKHAALDKKNDEAHEAIKADVAKILKCVEKSESRRQAGKMLQYQFMSAVKEKLELEFNVPTTS